MKRKSAKAARDRKFFVILPVLALPFITAIFWLMGGGSNANEAAETEKLASLNATLPDAKSDDKPKDKLSYYNIATRDSIALHELIKNDPNYQDYTESDSQYMDSPNDFLYSSDGYLDSSPEANIGGGYNHSTSQQIYQKLHELDREMQHSQRRYNEPNEYADYDQYAGENRYQSSPDIERLEQMMLAMNQPTDADPEMEQINQVLEKIIDIQNPGRIHDKMQEASEARRGEVFAVSGEPQEQPVSLLDGTTTKNVSSGFYSLDDQAFSNDIQNAIQAVIHEEQTLVNGSTVKLRLLNDVYINGVRIPKNNFLYGTARLNGERLGVKIESIRYDQSIFPVDLTVYDMDGLDGLYIPGSITRDVAKKSADQPLQNIGITSLNDSWGVQAASAGVEVAKGLFSKKVKLVKVTVKAGYQVLLRDEKRKED